MVFLFLSSNRFRKECFRIGTFGDDLTGRSEWIWVCELSGVLKVNLVTQNTEISRND